MTPESALDAVRLETEVFGLMPDAIGESAELLANCVADGTTRAFLPASATARRSRAARLVPGSDRRWAARDWRRSDRQRRRGYGRMLTAIATRAGLATGHKLVWLSVDEANTAAVELYRSLGFEPAFAWTRWLAPA